MLIEFDVVSIDGTDQVTLPTNEAAQALDSLLAEGKWIYIDGQHWGKNKGGFTEQVLIAAENITVTNPLMSG